MGGAAIVGAISEKAVDLAVLRAHGLKVRTTPNSVPDLILSSGKHSSAYMLLSDSFDQQLERYYAELDFGHDYPEDAMPYGVSTCDNCSHCKMLLTFKEMKATIRSSKVCACCVIAFGSCS